MKLRQQIQLYDFGGKVFPQATEVEQAVIGTFMLESDCYLNNPINPEYFYKEEHKKICETIQEMTRQSRKIDLLTVTMRLKEKGLLEEIGGPLYITQCTSMVASAFHISQHILIIKEKYFRREMIRMSHELMSSSFDESTELQESIESAQSIFMKILSDEENYVRSFDQVALDISVKMDENFKNESNTGLLTGLRKLDEFSYGLQLSDLVLIAAETSHGKTTLAINISAYAAKNNHPTAYYSLEMNSMQLCARILAAETGISSKRILYQKIFSEELTQVDSGITRLQGIPMYFDDKCSSNISKMCASIRKMVLKYGIEEVVIDYLQLITGDKSQGQEAEVGQHDRILKNLAKELNIVVVLLSQLRRADDHVPTMNRLRASGQIEEASDTVILLWIPEIEGITYLKKGDGREVDMSGKADIIVAKGRNIGTMNFTVNCNREINKMWNEDEPRLVGKYHDPNRTTEPGEKNIDDRPF
ncbi:MAG: AAA family ATPase [Bacteroidetes bacterium]|nr:AAA family ATPase [Bacteroidota bacterium]